MSAINLYQLMHGLIKGNSNPYDIKIVIPKIQRDYAEGRETESVEKKRISLLQDMLDVVFGSKTSLSLDFVYGTTSNNTFYPLDGQQRLTTLFLLHWLFGRNKDIIDTNNHSTNNHSLFVYETRKTSEDFCHWLVNQNATRIISDWKQSVNSTETINENNKKLWNTATNMNGVVDKIANRLKYPLVHVPTLFDHFMGIDDFKWEWHIDPNIHSMIVVIETACQLIKQKGGFATSNNSYLDHITFELLDNLNCDGDELFEKMNARGKALSSFDLLKSSLEEELEKQSSPTINNWRKSIDNDWIDYCWDNSNIPSNPSLDDVKRVEEKLERLLIRLIGKSFYNTNIIPSTYTPIGSIAHSQNLSECIFKDCDNIVENYFKYARFERAVKNTSFTKLNFDTVYSDFNNLIFTKKDTTGNDMWCDIAQHLHDNGLHMHSDNNNTLLDDYSADNLNHDTRVIFYAMMAYLNHVPAKKMVGDSKTSMAPNSIEFENFKDWMRFVRNVFLMANKNARIDKPELVIGAIKAIDEWLDIYFSTYHKGVSNKEILFFIAKEVCKNPKGQEVERLNEESLKAQLRFGGFLSATATPFDWENAILSAEENPYLWGQIIAPLKWSFINNQYDLNEFEKYMLKLNELFSYKSLDKSNLQTTSILLIQAALSINKYRFNGNTTWGSLGTLNIDRDVSWKRHLREQSSNIYGKLIYGELIKKMVDEWIGFYPSITNYSTLLTQIINKNKVVITISDWRYFIINLPTSYLANLFEIAPTSFRYINEDNGHVYVYRSKSLRSDAIRYELLISYLYVNSGTWNHPWKAKDIDHYLGGDGAYVEFQDNKTTPNKVRITPNTGGLYDIDNNGTIIPNCDIPTLEKELQNIGVITGL